MREGALPNQQSASELNGQADDWTKEEEMRKVLQIGGFVAAAVLIVFGVAAIVMGINGRNTVQTSLKQEHIVGSPDMTPALIKAEAKQAGLPSTTTFPSVSVAGKAIDNGRKASVFASYMRIHALEASGGLTYSQMPRFATQDGKGTNDPTKALQVNGRPAGRTHVRWHRAAYSFETGRRSRV